MRKELALVAVGIVLGWSLCCLTIYSYQASKYSHAAFVLLRDAHNKAKQAAKGE